MHCVDTISSTTDVANVTYTLAATTEDGETTTSTRAVVLTAENETGFWKFISSSRYKGTDVHMCGVETGD